MEEKNGRVLINMTSAHDGMVLVIARIVSQLWCCSMSIFLH